MQQHVGSYLGSHISVLSGRARAVMFVALACELCCDLEPGVVIPQWDLAGERAVLDSQRVVRRQETEGQREGELKSTEL